jgi:hypothetical protein
MPLPSVILLNVPIFLLAASILSVFLSKPASARSTTLLSPSNVWPNCIDCCFNNFAMSSRFVVSDSCSLRSWESAASVFASDGSTVVVEGFEEKSEFPDAACVPAPPASALPLRRSCDARPCAAFWNASLPSAEVVTSRPASVFTLGAYEGNWSSSSSSESTDLSDSASSSWFSSYIR